jgi:hypothetical protein
MEWCWVLVGEPGVGVEAEGKGGEVGGGEGEKKGGEKEVKEVKEEKKVKGTFTCRDRQRNLANMLQIRKYFNSNRTTFRERTLSELLNSPFDGQIHTTMQRRDVLYELVLWCFSDDVVP